MDYDEYDRLKVEHERIGAMTPHEAYAAGDKENASENFFFGALYGAGVTWAAVIIAWILHR